MKAQKNTSMPTAWNKLVVLLLICLLISSVATFVLLYIGSLRTQAKNNASSKLTERQKINADNFAQKLKAALPKPEATK